MKRAALYLRVSTLDQHPETQLHDLRQLAEQRGFEITEVYTDHGISGTRSRRPALDRMLVDARRGKFQVVAVWSCDRLARSTRHFLEVLDELAQLNIQFISRQENIDSAGALGKAIVTIIAAISELERNLIVERVRAGMRRARLEGQRLGRPRLELDQQAIVREREAGLSLGQIAKRHVVSRTTIHRVLNSVPKGSVQTPSQVSENRQPESAA